MKEQSNVNLFAGNTPFAMNSLDKEEESGATVAMSVPSLKQMGAAGLPGGGFSVPPVTRQKRTIIRMKKRAVSFERRFLSAGTKTNHGVLEIAMVWRDNVMSIKQYPLKKGTVINVGIDPSCDYLVDTHMSDDKLPILGCGDNSWEIIFNTSFEGIVLEGDRKTAFKDASSSEFKAPSVARDLLPGSLAVKLTGKTRAKFVFGEVSILVHFVEPTSYAVPFMGGMKVTDCGALIASILLHAALFSIVLFSTNRVDALMVDRIMTSSRFAIVVEDPVEESDKEEPEPEVDEDPDTDVEVESVKDNHAVATGESVGSGNTNTHLNSTEARQAAQGVGLLNQANTMNSMIASAFDTSNIDNLDWTKFDSSVAGAVGSYGLNSTGTAGGSASMGNFGGGGFGQPGGKPSAISTAAETAGMDLGPKKRAEPRFIPQKPNVSGSIDQRIIQKIVKSHTNELRACYERELAKVKGLGGRIVTMWIIDIRGSVVKAGVTDSTMNNRNVEDCIVNSIKFWRFPAPKGGGMVSVEYPFVFETGGN